MLVFDRWTKQYMRGASESIRREDEGNAKN